MAATKLRTEVIVNLTVVVGAALVFSGILLLWLMERELLAQHTQSQRRAIETVAVALATEQDAATLPELARRLMATVRADGWYLYDAERRALASESAPGRFTADFSAIGEARTSRTPLVHLDYRPGWLPRGAAESFFLVTQPVKTVAGESVLQARFTLAEVDAVTARARRFFLTFLILYLVVLVGFGAYLLGRTVIRPVMALRQATGRVAQGDLDQPVPVAGPAEIGELAGSFNGMMIALAASRAEIGASIRSLQEANAALRRTQSELIRSEKLASVGRLAAGMAHEIGNPLGAVVGYLGFLRAQQGEGSPAADVLDRSQAELARIDRLVRDLLDYAAPHKEEAAPCDPAAVFAEARDLLDHQGLFEGVRLEDALPPALPAVRLPRHKLLQVLVNLLLNARDAVTADGRLRLTAACDGHIVRLAVADNGVGIDAETLERIFDPFFTTKAPGRGRGLGLAVCHRIVEESGGRIEVTSTAGVGSVFTICLPYGEGRE